MTTTASYLLDKTALRKLPAVLLLSLFIVVSRTGSPAAPPRAARHVILISLDGFHDLDLTRYVAAHPDSAMARLVNSGVVGAERIPSANAPGEQRADCIAYAVFGKLG